MGRPKVGDSADSCTEFRHKDLIVRDNTSHAEYRWDGYGWVQVTKPVPKQSHDYIVVSVPWVECPHKEGDILIGPERVKELPVGSIVLWDNRFVRILTEEGIYNADGHHVAWHLYFSNEEFTVLYINEGE